jgi:hypothetical protein
MKVSHLVNFFSKYIVFVVVIFSVPSFVLFYNYGNIGYFEKPNDIFKILCIFNLICVTLFLIINIRNIDRNKKYNIIMTILLSIYFVFLMAMNIDFYFFGYSLKVVYSLLNLVNLFLFVLIGIIPYFAFNSSILNLPDELFVGIIGFLFTVVYNIVFTLVIMKIKYKKEIYKYLLYLLYYIQCNSCLVFLFYVNKLIQSA